MRKTTYFCDRCGKEITAKPLTFQATVRDVKAEVEVITFRPGVEIYEVERRTT